MSEETSPQAINTKWRVRRFRPEDAAGVPRLVQAVYGETYYPPALYDPQEIVNLNETGKLVSILAVDAESNVIGHYAMERFQVAAVAEASDAIVAVPYRHHHLMEDMRVLLREEAQRIGLIGLVGYPVTNHLFSQKAEEHFGAKPCGLAPGLWPRSFHNMPEPLPQRMSFVMYFKYLRPAREVVHAATPHSDMLERIAQQWSITIRRLDGAPGTGVGEITVEHEAAVETGTIRVHLVGADTAAAIHEAREELVSSGAKAIVLELPLAQPATADLCRDAEAAGFFFSGLGPAFAADGDALLMQFLAEDLDLALIQIDSPFAKELLSYVGQQREKVQRRPPTGYADLYDVD
jgi:hypothetical protein